MRNGWQWEGEASGRMERDAHMDSNWFHVESNFSGLRFITSNISYIDLTFCAEEDTISKIEHPHMYVYIYLHVAFKRVSFMRGRCFQKRK